MLALHARLAGFAQYIRDPHRAPRPDGLPARALAVYGGLLFENLASFLDSCLPVSRSVLGERRWRRLIRGFYRDWPSQSPWFRDIAREFADYLAANADLLRVPRWLPALSHYEWAELAVDTMAVSTRTCDPAGDLLAREVVINPAHMSLAYRWPVHRIGPSFRPRKPEPTQLVVYRDGDETVRFCLVNSASSRLLAILATRPTCGRNALRQLAEEIGHDPDGLVHYGAELLSRLHDAGLVLGTTAPQG